jgi:hypothetical protein
MVKKIIRHFRNGTLISRIHYEIVSTRNLFFRGIYNRVLYGSNSPKYRRQLLINTNQIKEICDYSYSRLDSGKVIKSNELLTSKSLFQDHYKFRYLYERYVEMVDPSMIVIEEGRTWLQIDSLYSSIKKNGLFKIYKRGDGIIVHIDESGNFIFGGGGFHRLGIAKILGIDKVLVEVGLVHVNNLGKIDFTV